MKNTYYELIDQTYYFPNHNLKLEEEQLYFHDIPLMDLIKEHGAPLRLTYLPKISKQIVRTERIFKEKMREIGYEGKYFYCYCTKSSHFSFILNEVIKNKVHLETSSAYDIDIIEKLHHQNKINSERYVICNGFKTHDYTQKIVRLINEGFNHVIPVLDNKEEVEVYNNGITGGYNIGIRIATEEEPNHEFYTSRLGIRYADILNFYKEKIKPSPNITLKMLHFFINTGMKDSAYYWSELDKAVEMYCQLKKVSPGLEVLNIGGGFPVPNSLAFEYDYGYMIEQILLKIKERCIAENVPMPDVFTEFGNYTVGESGAIIFKVLAEKQQNDAEKWYMINGSLMTALPDTWGIGQRYILLPLNQWNNKYQKVNIGGLTCDSQDYYNAEVHVNQVFMPQITPGEDLYLGFFNIGAYQESISGYGGIKHCLIPSPKHVIIDRDASDHLSYQIFSEQQSAASMMQILGY